MIPIFVAAFFVPVVLSKRHFDNLANVALIAVASFLLFFYSLILGKNSGAYLVFISLVPITVLLYNDLKKKIWILCTVAIPITLTYVLEWIDYRFYFEQTVLSGLTEKIIHGFALSTAFSFALFSAYLFYKSSKQQLDLLTQSNKDLEETVIQLKKSYHDLQEGKEMSQKLKVQADYASMVRAIAHEIKNPLGMLKIRSELVLQKLDDIDSIRKFADVIIRNVDRLNTLINTMLTYGSPVTKERILFDSVDVLQHLEILMEAPCAKKYIKMRTDYETVKPVYASKELIEQALINIVSNAIQYTPEGGEITLGVKPVHYHDIKGNERDGVEIWVKDTGCGIKPELVESVFEPYVSSKVVGANMGLGLAFVYRVVGENEGKVRVETEQGRGTTFFVSLPCS